MYLSVNIQTIWWIILSAIVVAIVIGFEVTVLDFLNRFSTRHSKWDCSINHKEQSKLEVLNPFDPNKEVLYVSRRMLGIWKSSYLIVATSNLESNLNILKILSKRYNLVLYIPKVDKDGITVSESGLSYSIEYIIKHQIPITRITQQLPSRKYTEPFAVNNGELWFIKYKGKGIDRWEEYM